MSQPDKNKIKIHNNKILTEPSKYRVLKRVQFTENISGHKRYWDYAQGHDSVFVIIFNKTQNKLVFVRQFRIVLLMKNLNEEFKHAPKQIENSEHDRNLAVTLEFCAGLIDKNLSIAEIAKAEVEEETGYHISVDDLTYVGTYKSLDNGGHSHMYFCQVEDSQRKSSGGGVASEHEFIEVLHLDVDVAEKIMCGGDVSDLCEDYQKMSENKSYSSSYGMMWFLRNFWDKRNQS